MSDSPIVMGGKSDPLSLFLFNHPSWKMVVIVSIVAAYLFVKALRNAAILGAVAFVAYEIFTSMPSSAAQQAASAVQKVKEAVGTAPMGFDNTIRKML